MSLFYHLPERAAGMLVITFADHANNQFVDLAGFQFDTPAELKAAWDSIPAAAGETAFLVDRHVAAGHDADKYVTAEWIEARCGRPIADLIREGRTGLAEWMADFRAACQKRSAQRAEVAGPTER